MKNTTIPIFPHHILKARCKCGRLYTWKQVAEIASRPKIEIDIDEKDERKHIVMRKYGATYIYYVAP